VAYNGGTMEDQFKSVEQEFEQLRDKFRKKEISESDFKQKLKELRLQDGDGRFWTIGAQTGKWYYFDGDDWIEAKPPSLQEKKAICIYCGFENDLENESCSHCGESLKKKEDGEEKDEEFVCPKCGRKLDKYSFFCPDCDVNETPEEKVWETGETGERGEPEIEEGAASPEMFESEKTQDEGEARRERVLRYIQPFSMLLFFGAVGLMLGVLLGALAGATEFLMNGSAILPGFLRELQGSLIGGIFYGLFGGILGFCALGLSGFLGALLFNLIFSLTGGIRIHVEKRP
jgi:hypothetical protein